MGCVIEGCGIVGCGIKGHGIIGRGIMVHGIMGHGIKGHDTHDQWGGVTPPLEGGLTNGRSGPDGVWPLIGVASDTNSWIESLSQT